MSYIGRGLDKISNIEKLDTITFDGSSSYSLTKNSVAFTPNSANSLQVSIDGVVQAGNFTVSGSTIDFGTAVPSTSTNDFIFHYGTGVAFTPADGTVTTAKLADSSVSLAKLSATGTKDATTFLRGDNTFQTISSDYVLLGTVDITSSTAEAEFDGLFSSTYKNYKLICSGLLPVTNGARLRMQGKQSGSYVTGNYSYTVGGDFVYNSTDGGEGDEKNSADSSGLITSEQKNTTNEVNGFDMTIYDPLGSHYKAFNWHSHNWGSVLTNLHRNYIGTLMIRNSTADLTAIKFYFDSGNIAKGNFKLYGMK